MRDDVGNPLLDLHRIRASGSRQARKPTLLDVERQRARRALKAKWALRRFGGSRVEQSGNFARQVVGNREPVAPVALWGKRVSPIGLGPVVDRHHGWIGNKWTEPVVLNPHAGARKHHDATLGAGRMAERRVLYRATELPTVAAAPANTTVSITVGSRSIEQ